MAVDASTQLIVDRVEAKARHWRDIETLPAGRTDSDAASSVGRSGPWRERATSQSVRASELAALSLMMLVTGVSAQNTLTHGSSALFQGSTSRGTFASQADCVAAALALSIASQTSYQCRENLTVTPGVPPPPAPPTVVLSANPSTVTPGATSTLSWSSTNTTACTASGSWNGSKPTGGSEQTMALTATSTFSLACSGVAGAANASTAVNVAGAGSISGLNFPSNNNGDRTDVSFRFTGAALLPIQPATYIWKVLPRQQTGYYTTFFWGFGDGSFTGSKEYYGAHPYPNGGSSGTTHKWEISAIGNDFTTDATGNNTTVQYGRWHSQALVVAPSGTTSVLTFYWDLPDTTKRISVAVLRGGLSAPSSPALTFGAAPWAPHRERLSGVLRGIQLYSGSLSIADILSEADSPLSTTAGSAAIWYLNMNPTPSDISDKSGRGHHPTWSSTGRPSLWTQ